MTAQDLFITPFYLMIFYGLAFFIRPYVTNAQTRAYFIPGLTLKFVGAIAVGIVYQFYYNGGDTFNYFVHGSKWIWEAFLDDPATAIRLIFIDVSRHYPETFEYSQHIWYYNDPKSYFIVRMAAVFDIFTLHTYSATALFFAIFGYSGLWKLYTTFTKLFPGYHKVLAYSILFVPSVFFWGSGILKDTVSLGALCWCIYSMVEIFQFRRRIILNIFLIFLFGSMIFIIKKYILICFFCSAVVYVYSIFLSQIRSAMMKVLLAPIVFAVVIGGGYLALDQISSGDSRYSLDSIAETARITAYDIRYGWGARQGDNSGYTLGELDGTWQSMVKLMPSAINVSLFRPYLWEVKNPLMLLSALEAFVFLLLTLRIVTKIKLLTKLWSNPFLRFCLLFSLSFAFAVGVSTFNFGSLARYKIPLLPTYLPMLVLIVSKVRAPSPESSEHKDEKNSYQSAGRKRLSPQF